MPFTQMEPEVFGPSGLVENEDERTRALRELEALSRGELPPQPTHRTTAERGYEDIYGGDWGTQDLNERTAPYPEGADTAPIPQSDPRAIMAAGGNPLLSAIDATRTRMAARGQQPATTAPAETSPHPTSAGASSIDPRTMEQLRQVARWRFPERAVASVATEVGSEEAPEVATVATDENPRARLAQLLAERERGHDYTGVDVADAIATPFRALARALAARAGRPMQRHATWGEQARARDRQSDQDALRAAQAESQMRQQAQDRELAARRVGVMEDNARTLAESREANAALQATREERMGRIAERANDLRAQGMEAQAALTQARLELIQEQTGERRDARDPESETSARARERLTRELDFMSQASGRTYDISPEGMSAVDVEAVERRLGVPRHVRQRASGGGGGALRQPPEWFAGTPEEWRRLGTTGQRQEIQRHLHPRPSDAGDDGRIEIAPGVFSSLERLRGSDAAQLARGISTARAQSANIRGIGAIASRFPVGANISPEARAQLTPRLTIARGMVATLGQTGVINASEVPTINAALPNPGDLEQMTFGTFQARMREWNRILEERVRADLETNGVDEAGVNRVLGWLRGSGGGRPQRQEAAPPGGPQSDRVRVRHPDGRAGSIPRARLDAARAAGFEVVDGP